MRSRSPAADPERPREHPSGPVPYDGGMPLDPTDTNGTPEIDVREAAVRLARPQVLALDVREDFEWAEMRIDGATHVPLGTLDLATLPAHDEIVVICRSGHRSEAATAYLNSAGFDAVNMAGGMLAWVAAELPAIGSAIPPDRATAAPAAPAEPAEPPS